MHSSKDKNKSSYDAAGVSDSITQQLSLLKQLADNHLLAYYVRDTNGQLLDANLTFANYTGLDLEAVLDDRPQDLCSVSKTQLRSAPLPDFDDVSPDSVFADQPRFCWPVTDEQDNTVAHATFIGTNAVIELRQELVNQNKQLGLLQSLMTDLLNNKSVDTLLNRISDLMIRYTEADRALILLVNETGEYIQVVAGAGPKTAETIGETRIKGIGFSGVAWSTGETQYLADSNSTQQTRHSWPRKTQLLAVPFKVAGEVIGVAVLGAPASSDNLSQCIPVANSLTNLASYSIATANAMEKTAKELQNSRHISEISRMVTSANDIAVLLDSVAKKLVESFDFIQCGFFTVTNDQELHSNCVWIQTPDGIKASEPLPSERLAESSCFWSYKNKETVFISRKVKDPRESTWIHEFREKRNIGCSVTLPIIVNGDVHSVLLVCKSVDQCDCDENELNILSSIVQQLSAVIYGINASKALRHQAYHDSLTGLPNRRQFEEQLKQTLQICGENNTSCAVLYLDLDGFKTVNDTLGHGSGDGLLQMVSKRLQRSVKNKGSISRIGGDEFGVILPAIQSEQEAFQIAQNIRQSILNPFSVGESVANIGTSIGLCFFPTHGSTVDVLLCSADEAMYRAKVGGKNKVVCFEEQMADNARKRLRIESELHTALDNNEFELHYQPQVDPITGKVTGAEALIRWRHPKRGMIPPGDFIPVAEESGLITEIGSWVQKEAIMQLAAWKQTSLAGLKVSVNIAASQFLYGDFASRVQSLLEQHNVSSELLEVELTESVVIKDVEQVASQLAKLRELGVTVALDDFGTGYSSLSCLQDLPLDVLKIDRAFVRSLTKENIDNSIAKTIMLMASGLGLKTVTEGVETTEQLSLIMELGSTQIQGFYFSKPRTVDELASTVAEIQAGFDYQQAA